MNALQKMLAAQKAKAGAAAPATPAAPAASPKPSPLAGLAAKRPAAPVPPAAKPEEPAVTQVVADAPDATPKFDLSSIAGMALESAPVTRAADETPPSAVPRQLPPDMTPQQEAFVSMLDSLYESVEDHELLGQTCVSIMIELQENPQYEQMLADADVRALIQGARESMGLARIKKAETKAKRGGSKKKGVEAELDADVMAIFGGMT